MRDDAGGWWEYSGLSRGEAKGRARDGKSRSLLRGSSSASLPIPQRRRDGLNGEANREMETLWKAEKEDLGM